MPFTLTHLAPRPRFAYYHLMTFYFVKTHNDANLAHVYEHIYINFLRQTFLKQGLFVYLDFAVDGETFESYVHIAIKAYTRRAETAIAKAVATQATIDNYVIREAAYEIAAEHGQEIEGDLQKIEQELHVLAQRPWSNINDVVIKKREISKSSVVLESGKKVPTTQLNCRIVNNAVQNDEDAALFYVVA